MLPFEFRIDRPPVSQQASGHSVNRWRRDVRGAAELHWHIGEPPIDNSVMLTIMYFYESGTRPANVIDVDNVPKPVLDSLKGLVYQDDKQVTDMVCRKRELVQDLQVVNSSRLLDEGVIRGESFLYVLVEDAPDQEAIY